MAQFENHCRGEGMTWCPLKRNTSDKRPEGVRFHTSLCYVPTTPFITDLRGTEVKSRKRGHSSASYRSASHRRPPQKGAGWCQSIEAGHSIVTRGHDLSGMVPGVFRVSALLKLVEVILSLWARQKQNGVPRRRSQNTQLNTNSTRHGTILLVFFESWTFIYFFF